jgi:hypothetical protein
MKTMTIAEINEQTKPIRDQIAAVRAQLEFEDRFNSNRSRMGVDKAWSAAMRQAHPATTPAKQRPDRDFDQFEAEFRRLRHEGCSADEAWATIKARHPERYEALLAALN